MKVFQYLSIALLVGCVTHDNGCGSGGINSEAAERAVLSRYAASVTCIKDDEHTFSCADNERMWRCAESSNADERIKCIRWFPLQ